MKKNFLNIIAIIVGFLMLGLIIYLGQFFTDLKYKNKNILNSLETLYSNDATDWDKVLKDLQNTKSYLKTNLDDFKILSNFSKEIKLQEALISLITDLEKIQNGELLLELIKNKTEENTQSGDLLLHLNQNLNNLKDYHLHFVDNLEYQIKNWLIFLGYQKPKNYLLIFQETNVPRPTGGFLKAYGIITFNQGKLTLSGDSIYNLDDLLLDKIIPPYPLQTIANKWFFHDSNWFFDFPTTSKKIIELYQKTGLTPSLDGVIAINDTVLKSLLEITGPLELKDYNLTITADNFISFFTDQLNNNPQDILDEKRNIFSIFIQALFNKLQNLSLNQDAQIMNLLKESLNNKEIQIYSLDDEVEYYFDSWEWTGKLGESKDDYLLVVFSNIERTFTIDQRPKNISLETNISSSTVTDTLTISAPSFNKGDKNLETFLKIYLPQGVTIIKANGGYLKEINNDWPYEKLNYQVDPDIKTIENKTIIDKEKGIEISDEGSKTVVSTWAKLSLQPFSLVYQLPVDGNLDNWEIKIQKQSGQNINFSYNLIVPPTKKLGPTLFEFQKSFPLTKDVTLSFKIY